MAKKKSWLGWHFLPMSGKLRFGDGRKPKKGEKLTEHLWDGAATLRGPSLCERGFHASRNIIDALLWAPGPRVARVRLSGKIVRGEDKACATERTALTKYICVARELREFAKWCSKRPYGASCYSRLPSQKAARYAAEDARQNRLRYNYWEQKKEKAAQCRELERLVRKALRERG